MELKFLATEEITIEDGPIKITMHPVSTTVQGRLSELSMLGTVSERVKRIQYALKNVITSIEIEGKDYPPELLADTVDLSDKATRDAFIKIGEMVMSKAFPDKETTKKSGPPLKHGQKGGDASDAQDQKTDDNPDTGA